MAGTPCSVVVDSRNMYGQARRTIGVGGRISVPGIVSAMSKWGLDVQDVTIATATRLLTKTPSVTLQSTQAANLEAKVRWEADGARVIEGSLAERDGKLGEKQVDVQCALAVVDLAVRNQGRTIIVLSEDLDLVPGCDLAKTYGATCYTAAIHTVHHRTSDHGWLLLDTRAVSEMFGRNDSDADAAIRAHTVRRVLEWDRGAVKWRPRPFAVEGELILDSNRLVCGYWPTAPSPWPNGKLDLHVTGLRMDPRYGFPQVELIDTSPVLFGGKTEQATVLRWLHPDLVRVQLDSGSQQSIEVPSGELLWPGQRVLVYLASRQTGASVSYVGPLPVESPLSTWGDGCATFGTVTKMDTAWTTVRLPAGDCVQMRSQFVHGVEIGKSLRVSPAGFHPQTGEPQVVPLSSCFPFDRT